MELNKINSTGNWGSVAEDINQNFSKVNNAVEQVKNATTRNKGYFSTEADLKSAFTTANVGDIAYVGDAYPYQTWTWNGTEWVKKNNSGGDEQVNLGNYYTKEETDGKFDEADEKLAELGSEVDSLGSKVNVAYTNKYVNKYVNSEGVLKTDSHFDVFEFDINGATKLSMFYATGAGVAVFMDSLENVVGDVMKTEGPDRYESKWIDVNIPTDAKILLVTQAKKVTQARPLVVLMDRYSERFLLEEYREKSNTPFIISPLKNISYKAQGDSVEIIFYSSKYNLIDEYGNQIEFTTESGKSYSVSQYSSLFFNRESQKIEINSKTKDSKLVLLAYVEKGMIRNGLLANDFKIKYDTELLEKKKTLNDIWIKKPIIGSLYEIEPTLVEAEKVYKIDGTISEIQGYSTKHYSLTEGTSIKVTITRYYASSNFIHLGYIDENGLLVCLVDSVKNTNNTYYITIPKGITEVLASGCRLQGIKNDAVTFPDISTEFDGYYGNNELYSSAVTIGQAWFYEKPLEYSGYIESIDLPTENIIAESVHILVGYKINNDQIEVSYVQKCLLSSGNNLLDEPIPFESGGFIGFVTQTKNILYRESGGGTYECFASAEQSITNPQIGLIAIRSVNSPIKYGIGYNVVYYKDVKELALENSQKIKNLEVGKESILKGKKVLFIGDSITDTGYYVTEIANRTGCIAYNRGSSGSTLATGSNSMCDRLDMEANDSQSTSAKHNGFPTEADYVFILAGINDWGRLRSQVFGNLTDAINKDTFCGALKYMFRGLKLRYPNAKIVALNLLHTYSPTQFVKWRELSYENDDETMAITIALNNVGKSLYDYREAIEKAAKMYGLPVIDLFNVGFTATLDADREAYYVDGLHPNEAGGKVMADYILKQLDSI